MTSPAPNVTKVLALPEFQEKKVNSTVASGTQGFNIPSLFGLATGAPYFHHGQAENLIELLTDDRWAAHLKAGNSAFLEHLEPEERLQAARDLRRFLLSIDARTVEIAADEGSDLCPKECTLGHCN